MMFLLAIVALTFYHASAQLSGQTVKILDCDVTEYQGVMYNQDSLLGPNRFLRSSSIEECVQQCMQYRTPCTGINYLSDQQLCGVSSSSITAPDTQDPSTYDQVPESTHGSINCAPAAPTSPVTCGKQAPQYQPVLRKTQRIIGGTEAKPNSWPWLVGLTTDMRNGYIASCGSSLLQVKGNTKQSDIILTAAHCVTKEETQGTTPEAWAPDQFTAVAAQHHHNQADAGEQRRTGAQVVFHPDFLFTPRTGANNDLAIIKLDKPFTFTDKIRPVCLPAPGAALPVQQLCVVAGWGRNNSRTQDTANALQQIISPVYPASTCRRGWGSSYIEQQMVCSGDINGVFGTCQGDSGGTLGCQNQDGSWTVHGAVSFGVSGTCLQRGQPGIFTRVSSYIDWINQNVQAMTSL